MSTLRAKNIESPDANPVAIPSLDKRMASAWVNFNGTGTVAIRDSYNVASITDQGTGNYAVNFAVAMANPNYAVAGSAKAANAATTLGCDIVQSSASVMTTTAVQIQCIGHGSSTNEITDGSSVSVVTFGGRP